MSDIDPTTPIAPDDDDEDGTPQAPDRLWRKVTKKIRTKPTYTEQQTFKRLLENDQ